jgi:Universal stress protein family
MKRRRSFEAGHKRKFLLVVDDSTEVESALYYAASRVQRASGIIVMLYIIVPETYTHWVGVRERQIEEETATAKALFRLFRRKLNQDGFEDVETQEAIREGQKAEQIVQAIAEDDDIHRRQGSRTAGLVAGGRQVCGVVPNPHHCRAGQSCARRHQILGITTPNVGRGLDNGVGLT